MILVNRNFGNPVLAEVIGDMFRSTSDDGMNIEWVNHTNALATNSTLVASLAQTALDLNSNNSNDPILSQTLFKSLQQPKSFFIVTEHFIKVLDKVYTKIWNESFTEIGIYNVSNLVTLYNGFVNDTSLLDSSKTIKGFTNPTSTNEAINFMMFKKFVDRCITAGILLEEDRLDYKDQISLSNLNKADLSTQIDLDNKLITFTAAQPIDITPDLNGLDGNYLAGKKLYLFMTPYLNNESTVKSTEMISHNALSDFFIGIPQEPFKNYLYVNINYSGSGSPAADYVTPVRRPIAFFKPKTDASKFGRSLPLATHLLWSIGTPADKEIALIEGTPIPDLVFDHLDRISHIDSLVLKIKFDKLQF